MSARTVDPSISRTPLPTDAENLATVCVLCSHNCGLRVDVADGRIVAVRADESSPISHGYICNKGFSIGHYVEHKQRTEHPLKRRPDGSFERITWEQAISEIAARLASIRAEHSPRAIGLVGIGGQANHMDAPYGLNFLSALGSKRWFNAFAQEKTQHFLIDQWMFDAPPSVFFHPDVDHTHFLLMMGTNPKISNRGHNATDTFKAFAANPEQKLVVLDPRETETTRTADRHLRIKPGSDAYVLLGMAAAIVSSEGLVDARVVDAADGRLRGAAPGARRRRHRRDGARAPAFRPRTCSTSRASTPAPSRRRSCSTSPSSTICSRRSPRTSSTCSPCSPATPARAAATSSWKRSRRPSTAPSATPSRSARWPRASRRSARSADSACSRRRSCRKRSCSIIRSGCAR